MQEPTWLREAVILALHRLQLEEHGGLEGIRDSGLLQSALARPKNLWALSETKPDFGALAAAYAFGISRNHPFLDGNKRTALVAARTFLRVNGKDLLASQEEKYLTFLRLADGGVSEDELAAWIRARLR